MGILQNLFGGSKKEVRTEPVENAAEKLSDAELARKIAGEIVAQYTQPALRFTLERGEEPGIFESKVGGTPYLPHDMAWPVDSKGMDMELLAQVDCAALTGLSDFPHTGLLQFFFGLDDVFGADFDHMTEQKDFRVLYHETVDSSVTAEDVLAKKAQTSQPNEDERKFYTPLMENTRIVFSAPAAQHISEADYRATEEFVRRWNAGRPGAELNSMWDFYRALPKDESWEIFPSTEDKGPHHQLGGYPYFTQEDPRTCAGELADLDVLLFQLDSDMQNREDLVLWGDCGVANFFISREALKRRDFSRVAYNWDCC